MRDLFAILAIILAVVSLGLFRVPDENALLAAGIRAEAQAALYQSAHPLTVEVKGRVITVSGRVETEEARQATLDTLAALEGVEDVVDRLTLLPQVTPFTLGITRTADTTTYTGHLPSEALGVTLSDLLGPPPGEDAPTQPATDLPLGAGAPDGFSDVATQAARALAMMLEGRATLTDRSLTLTGQTHLPAQKQAIEAALTLPEDWTLTLDVTALDDGLPYALLATRDPLMGLHLSGKLPPDFDTAPLDALHPNHATLTHAPLPLDQPGFTEAVALTLPLLRDLPNGTLTIAPATVTLTGGPLPDGLISRADALRDQLPAGYALHLSLTPEDHGDPLSLTLDWNGTQGTLTGRVPRDFQRDQLAALGPVAGEPERSPYPDLSDWDAPLAPGLAALKHLDSGQLTLDTDGLRVTGIAANPGARALAKRALGGAGTLTVDLADDGRPAAFTLKWTAGAGGSVTGKLPADLTTAKLADALGIPTLRGTPAIAPTGQSRALTETLAKLRPVLSLLDTIEITAAPDATTITATTSPGLSPETFTLPPTVTLTEAPPPPAGTRRTHSLLDQPQIFTAGHWLPDLGGVPTLEGCAEYLLPPIPFAENRFVLGPDTHWPLAEWAALGRACTRFNGLTMAIDIQSPGTLPELAAQLARRRAEAIRTALIARGIDPQAITATGTAAETDGQRITWK
ncbi:BON domain-containing protein [Sagittula sp. S175]|uniref:BON domain-containing protein n=1 Tax=Sagittula sp. S175 TaxID=3415129 RepID=UPI003C7C2F2E